MGEEDGREDDWEDSARAPSSREEMNWDRVDVKSHSAELVKDKDD